MMNRWCVMVQPTSLFLSKELATDNVTVISVLILCAVVATQY